VPPDARIALHVATFIGVVALTLLAGQNPRVLLYGLLVVLLWEMLAVWYVATFVERHALASVLLARTRSPGRFDRGKPYRHEKTRERAGIGTYVVGILTLMFMVGILQLLAGGPAFARTSVLLPELAWAAGIAVIFVIEDLVARKLIIDREAAVYRNLGYKTPALNFMLAAIMIRGIVLPVVANLGVWLRGSISFHPFWIDRAMLIVLAGLKTAFDIEQEIKTTRQLQPPVPLRQEIASLRTPVIETQDVGNGSHADRTPRFEPRLMWEVEHIQQQPGQTRPAVPCRASGAAWHGCSGDARRHWSAGRRR
jgi:hypothetical protein